MKTTKKILSLMLVLCMTIASVLVFTPVTADADAGFIVKKYAKKITVTTDCPGVVIDMHKQIKGAKSVTVTSSKKSVAKAEKNGKKFGGPMVTVKKAGTTKLTVKVKKGGKTKKYVISLKVVKYSNPFKSFKIAGKNCNKFSKRSNGTAELPNGTSGAIKITPKKGWKVKKIVEYIDTPSEDSEGNFDLKTTKKTIKNGANVKFDFDYHMYCFEVTMYKASNNLTEMYVLYIDEAF